MSKCEEFALLGAPIGGFALAFMVILVVLLGQGGAVGGFEGLVH